MLKLKRGFLIKLMCKLYIDFVRNVNILKKQLNYGILFKENTVRKIT